jgi:hypothetical protein
VVGRSRRLPSVPESSRRLVAQLERLLDLLEEHQAGQVGVQR